MGNGNSISFWSDPWVPNLGRLMDSARLPISQREEGERIHHFVTASGQLNFNHFMELLPDQIVNRIKTIIPPHVSSGEDSLAWDGAVDGYFSISQAFTSLLSSRGLLADDIFNVIWKWKGPERMRFLLCKAARGILMINEVRYRRGLTNSDLCPICHQHPETSLHLFRDCGISKVVWLNLMNDIPLTFFEEDNFERWLLLNLKAKGSLELGKWNLIFATTLVRLWWARNELVFKQTNPCSM